MNIIRNLTDEQLRKVRANEATAAAKAQKQAAFLETGLTDAFSAIDAELANRLAQIPTMTRSELEAL